MFKVFVTIISMSLVNMTFVALGKRGFMLYEIGYS